MLNVWLVTAGRGTMTLRGRTYVLEPGDCFVIRMNEPCSGRPDPKKPLTVHWAFIEYPLGWPVGDDHLPAVHRHIRDLRFMTALFERAILAQQEGDVERVVRWMLVVMRALCEDDERSAVASGPMGSLHYEQIHAICSRVQNKPGDSYRIPAFARECHCTSGHFTRRFEKYMGINPRQFIVNARIDAARSLLRMSDHSVSTIADSLGYSDVFHFSKQFKQKTGLSPSQFRRET